MNRTDGHEILHHLFVDYLVKAGIVVVAVVLVVTACVVIWRRTGRPQSDDDGHESGEAIE